MEYKMEVQKTETIRIRVDKKFKEYLQQKADISGITLSEFIRTLADETKIENISKILETIFINKSLAKKIIFLYNKDSNNLNQLAKAANTANLSGKITNDVYIKYLYEVKNLTNEVKQLNSLIKFAGNNSNVN
jgi:antitoxin component of RelBE/YafQ-DinJ toxin-antitoxin module